MIKVSLIGLGKTGKEIAKELVNNPNINLVSVMCSPDSSKKNMDLGSIINTQELGIEILGTDNLEESIFKFRPDVIIDFSSPKATMKNAIKISELKVKMVIGTTGFTPDELEQLESIARTNHSGIVYAPNITLGVNVLMILSKITSTLLSDYDFHITEVHHKEKKDSPSGTAIKIGNEIKDGLNYSGKDMSDTIIPISSVRAGGVVGKHEVMIVGENDKITISHESFSRKAFALGAVHAIKFINKKVGFYEMSDVLGLSKVMEDLYYGKTVNKA